MEANKPGGGVEGRSATGHQRRRAAICGQDGRICRNGRIRGVISLAAGLFETRHIGEVGQGSWAGGKCGSKKVRKFSRHRASATGEFWADGARTNSRAIASKNSVPTSAVTAGKATLFQSVNKRDH